jgi:molybdopterin-guanine dinucleotide biosynthesis protein A
VDRDASNPRRALLAGLLLTGGASSRLGRDKTQLVVDGVTLAQRTARLLGDVVEEAFEIGPGRSGLRSRADDAPASGPLVAVCVGRTLLRDNGLTGDAMVVASDLPRLNAAVVAFLAHFEAPASVVPVVHGVAQPLCARWAARDLDDLEEFVAAGERRVRWLLSRPELTLLDESQWGHVASPETFADVDTPDDARRLGIDLGRGRPQGH